MNPIKRFVLKIGFYWEKLIVNLGPLPFPFHPSKSTDCLIGFFRKSKYLHSELFECLPQNKEFRYTKKHDLCQRTPGMCVYRDYK
jgi:hypothetical protein